MAPVDSLLTLLLNHGANELRLATDEALAFLEDPFIVRTSVVGEGRDIGSGRVFGETAFVPPVQNAYNLAAERSLSEGDISQRLVISHTILLPFGKGRPVGSKASGFVDFLIGGWSASGAVSWNKGFPLALTSTGNGYFCARGAADARWARRSWGRPVDSFGTSCELAVTFGQALDSSRSFRVACASPVGNRTAEPPTGHREGRCRTFAVGTRKLRLVSA